MEKVARMISVVSGGLDSITMVHRWHSQGIEQRLLSFNYGQRHAKELRYAEMHARLLGLPHEVINLSDVRNLLTASALTSDIAVPEGHYSADNMAITVVPNRNAIMLTIAASYAVSMGASCVSTAVHAGDHAQYPDCRLEFFQSLGAMWAASLGNVEVPMIFTPYLYCSKAEIVREAWRLGFATENTWSCYKGGDQHCGRCGTCVERIEAFRLAGVADRTQYEDSQFWLEVTNRDVNQPKENSHEQ